MTDIRQSPLYNEDLAPVPQSRRDWGVYNYASLWVGMSVCIPTYMLASTDCRGHELAAGYRHHPAGQSDRAGPHAAERACGDQIRHPVSGAGARSLRSAGLQRAGLPAGIGSLRLVRDTDLDRRAGHSRHAADCVARLEPFHGRCGGLLPVFLVTQHAGDLARHCDHQVPGRHRRAFHAGGGGAAAVVGHAQSRRLRPRAERAQPVSRQRRVPSFFRSGAHRHGGLGPPWRRTFPTFHAMPDRKRRKCRARRWDCRRR